MVCVQIYAERDIMTFVDNPFVVSLYCSFETQVCVPLRCPALLVLLKLKLKLVPLPRSRSDRESSDACVSRKVD